MQSWVAGGRPTPSPTLPTRTRRFPAEKLPDTPAARPTPSCPPRERPRLWFPNSYPVEGAPGDRRTDQGFSNASGQWEGAWWGRVFLLMVEWVCQAPWAGLGGKSSFWRGWPGLGYQERARGARLGADEVEAQPRAMALAQARGSGGVVGKVFPSARRGGGRLGLRWIGWEGSLCSGLVTREHLPPPPGLPHPRWPSWEGVGMGPGSRGWGGTRAPQLSVFGAAQRKTFSRWEVPHMATGDPLGAEPPLPQTEAPDPPPGLMPTVGARRPGSDATPGLCPTSAGGDESANRGPPLGWEAPGRGRSRM